MSCKPSPILSEMPWNIKQDIIDSTDFKTRCSLRKCSKTLRSQVNNSYAFIHPLAFIPIDGTIRITWGNDDDVDVVIYYRPEADGCSVNNKFLFGENYIERAVADFAAVVKHPRTVVDDIKLWDCFNMSKLQIRQNQMILRVFEKEFSSFPMRLVNLQFYLKFNQRDQMRVLALTRPGTLKMIGLESIDEWQDTRELISSEHWKRARAVDMIDNRNIPTQSLMHFHKWHLQEIRITEEDMKALVEKILEFGESFREGNAESVRITQEAVNYLFTNFWHRTETEVGVVKDVFVKKMPGTKYYLKIKFRHYSRGISTKFSKVLSSKLEE